MKSLSFVAALALLASSFTAFAAPLARPAQDIKIGGLKVKNVKKRDGKLKDGKIKTPFGKAKVSNGKLKVRS